VPAKRGFPVTQYLRPLVRTGTLGKPAMEDGQFRNPPVHTALGGFTSASKLTDPSGQRYKTGGMSLEKGGPTVHKGNPV
jgi:hypothetical protein